MMIRRVVELACAPNSYTATGNLKLLSLSKLIGLALDLWEQSSPTNSEARSGNASHPDSLRLGHTNSNGFR
ncbi:hypothetical protein TNCV_2181751 [Trichonephila clavipes]|uniref:Uncharacterized protein n=1 Tax=Trichonephila clavipes TaxID=2585209 RepID=A0A8X6VUY6_TRICX|nr:hypothetical protein TNCV_2181751 [Trichonephila clavipes]